MQQWAMHDLFFEGSQLHTHCAVLGETWRLGRGLENEFGACTSQGQGRAGGQAEFGDIANVWQKQRTSRAVS